ncbi:MAG: glycosyltransferase family 2 protein [Sideroxydans sp.]|nr:glycosyltransferase family 2 protein [Sideroxydans sp.]
MDKLVSVIIPTYNRKELTDKAVSSVITSFPSLVEIVVVDDCGTVAYSFDAINSSGVPVRVIRLVRNVGAGMARQAGVAQATAKFIGFLDSDDSYDSGWVDSVLALLQADSGLSAHRVLISGVTQGERKVGALTRRMLAGMPQALQLVAARMVATMFNPFYTPSIVISRELCFFKESLRHCEDYYSNVFALFGADKIILPHSVACHLGRSPNSAGGESAAKEKMFKGEMQVRSAMLQGAEVPLGYKLMVPVGMLYQLSRYGTKRILSNSR